MATKFSAGAQALGYLHQVRYSLYSLLVDQRGDTELYVEELDDVVRKNQEINTLEQLKHHMDADATINEYSSELWRTLRVWFTEWDEGKLKPEEAVLCLITTAAAEADSPAALLRPVDARDVTKARERLVEVATEAKNVSLKKAFDAFLNSKVNGIKQVRTELDQDRLLASVVVIDSSLTIDQVEPKIKQLINGIRASHLDAAYERLEGWWFNKIIQHLLGGSKNPVSQYEVKEIIAEIGEQFRPDSLPIDYEDYELTPLQETEHSSRLFVQQLSAINIVGMRLYNAVLDYYRAFEQRSKWTRES
ncbi:MAG TPA: ABC-three component system protein, partial [Hymenobacter sp.]